MPWAGLKNPQYKIMSVDKTLNFGDAIEAIKRGEAVRRTAWSGIYIYLNKGSIDGDYYGFKREAPEYPHGSTISGIDLGLFGIGDKGTTARLPNINMSTESGVTVTGWLASQTDMLAEDWVIVD